MGIGGLGSRGLGTCGASSPGPAWVVSGAVVLGPFAHGASSLLAPGAVALVSDVHDPRRVVVAGNMTG